MIRYSRSAFWPYVALVACINALPAMAQQREPPKPKSEPMAFELVTNDPDLPESQQTRWIAAKGSIIPDTAKTFEAFARGTPLGGLTIYFDSPGGSVTGGIDLGEALRRANARVAIGRSTPVGTQAVRPPGGPNVLSRHQLAPNSGQCNSSCGYAFLGGRTRTISSNAFFGVHMFWPSDRTDQLYQQKYGAADIERAQRIAGRLAAYIQRMGVDVRMLELAGTTPHRAPIRQLTRQEIISLKIATIEFDVPQVPREGNWGLAVSENSARLLTGGSWSSPGRPDVRYQLEFGCSGYPGFHNVRFEQAISKQLDEGKAIAMQRVLIASGTKDAVIAFSGKDIRATPPAFNRLTSSRPGGWVAKSGRVIAEVIENAAQHPDQGLKVLIDEGDGIKSEIALKIGNLPSQIKAWTATCDKIAQPKDD